MNIRQWRLVRYLNRGERVSARILAEEFDVSIRYPPATPGSL